MTRHLADRTETRCSDKGRAVSPAAQFPENVSRPSTRAKCASYARGGFFGAVLFAVVLSIWSGYPLYRYESYPDSVVPGHSQPGPAEGHWWPEFASRDTYAQWTIAGLTALATMASLWALFLLRATLRLNQLTTRAQIRATQAATRSALAAERAFLLENRPWLPVKGAAQVAIDSDGKATLAVTIEGSLIGNTPAVDVRCEVLFSIGGAPPRLILDDLQEAIDRQVGSSDSTVVAPRDTFSLSVIPLVVGDDFLISRSEKSTVLMVQVACGIRYKSIFDDTPHYSLHIMTVEITTDEGGTSWHERTVMGGSRIT